MDDQSLEDLANELVNADPLISESDIVMDSVEIDEDPVRDDTPSEEEETDSQEEETEEENTEETEEEAEEETDTEEEENTEEAEEETDTEEESTDADILMAMDGEEEIEVPTNLEIKVGDEQVNITKLLETYEEHKKTEGTRAEFETQHTAFTKEKEAFNGNASKFRELVAEGKAQEALDFVLGVAGIDSEHFSNQYVSQLAPKFEEFMQLTPAEQEQRQAQQENEYLKRQINFIKNQEKSQQESNKIKKEINSVLEKNSMSLKEFEELQGSLLQLVDEGRLDKAMITPDFIGQQHLGVKKFERAYKILEEIDPELVNNKVAVNHLVSIQDNDSNATEESLKKQAERAFLDSAKQKITKRVKKNVTKNKARKLGKKQRAVKASKSKNNQALTFDELDLNELTNLL